MRSKIRRVFIGLLAGVMLACPVFTACAFSDVDGSAEYVEAADFLNEIGVMVGDKNGNFNPNQFVTRAEMATIICRMLGETDGLEADGSVFSDVPASHWANGYVARAASLGIIGGYGDGRFGPEDTVTYEQAVKMVVCAVGRESDANNAGGYPEGFISVASTNGYLEGSSANNGDQMVRWQIAIILYNIMMGGTGE